MSDKEAAAYPVRLTCFPIPYNTVKEPNYPFPNYHLFEGGYSLRHPRMWSAADALVNVLKGKATGGTSSEAGVERKVGPLIEAFFHIRDMRTTG